MRCAVYARVSTELDSQRTSIDNQINIFRNYATQQNWEIVKIYTDKQSGTKENRPGLKALIDDGKAGIYDVILAKELSRLARNGRLSYELRDICQFNNIDIVCLDNSVNTLEGNVQNFGLYAWLYENESANSSRRNKQAKRVKAQRGLFVGSNPPYGYRTENGVLKVRDDETPSIIRRIFKEYLEGAGMDSIAKKLTAEGVPTPAQIANKSNASKLWHGSSIKIILNNWHYSGDLVQSRTETISVTSSKRREVNSEDFLVIEGTHEAIIPKEMFHAVQTMLQKRTRSNTAPKRHLFTNMLYCEDCHRGMWYKANQKGYRCGGNIKHGKAFCLNKVVIREKELKHIILDDLQKLFNSIQEESFINSFLNKLNVKKRQLNKELKKIEAEVDGLRNKKLEYVNLYTENVISKDELVEYRVLTDNKIEALQKKKMQMDEKRLEYENEDYAVNIGNKLKDVLTLKELTPNILHSLVEKITCEEEGNIRIQYSFVNPFQEM
ncbi:recombinase family protein [Virgibacillus halodenitrificans]|uniref:recombinase family protein n=1 Tax=Virgibacillus halodenitrificans TaxID=1482 RepID=UPI001FB3A8B9|nr:recombinase family protein [Virgibacillus halodenitrificans]MCJ0931902.1 recombinase family protein [Virgibacillus halodenitrificans]